MTIAIEKPELERRVREEMERGGFQSEIELLAKALDALAEKEMRLPGLKRPAGRKSLVELFAESPLKGLDLDFSRNRSTGRRVDLQ